MNEAINHPRHRLAALRSSFSQGCTATGTFVHAVDGQVTVGAGRPDAQSTLFVGVLRFDICAQQVLGHILVANPLVLGALVDEPVDSEAVKGDPLHSLTAAAASSDDKRLWGDLASPLPFPSAAYPQLAALAS